MRALYDCDHLVVSCIDFRIQSLVASWLHTHFAEGTYDYASFAGSAKNGVLVQEHVSIAERLHHIKDVILIAHGDCGAYGRIDHVQEMQIHDLQRAKQEVLLQYPDLVVHLYYLHVSGVFEEIA